MYLLDTNILLRLANAGDVQHVTTEHVIKQLLRRGEQLHITPQNLVEFRSVATRPQAVNGLGLDFNTTEAQSAAFEVAFPLLHETPAIFPVWKALVNSAQVSGKQVHDARLLAVCQVYAVSRFLTFNVQHFTRFAVALPQVTIVDPAAV